MKKIFLRFTDIIMAAMVVAALTIVIPNTFGVKTLAVLSGSMKPNIPKGSMVFVTPTKPAGIVAGDLISYSMSNDQLVTSRVTQIDIINKLFIVKDDLSDDSEAVPVAFDNIIGVVKFSVPAMGYLLGYVLTTQGKVTVITAVLVLIIIMALLGGQDPETKEPEKQIKKHNKANSKKTNTYSRDYRYKPKYYSGGRNKGKNNITYD